MSSPPFRQRNVKSQVIRLITVSALVLTCVAALGQPVHTITGTVTSERAPVSGATVYLISLSGAGIISQTKTDSAGSFRLQAAPGEFAIETVPSSKLLFRDRFNLTVDGDTNVQVPLDPVAKLGGTVTRGPGRLATVDIEVRSVRSGLAIRTQAPGGVFSIDVPAGPIAVLALPRDSTLRPSRVNLDLTGFSFGEVMMGVSEESVMMPPEPPVASRITISAPDENGIARIRGEVGAVISLSSIFVANLATTQVNFGVSAKDGSFEVPMFAPPGSQILVKHDPTARHLSPRGERFSSFTEGPPGTIIRVPDGGAATLQKRIDDAIRTDPVDYPQAGTYDAGQLWISGAMPKKVAPGELVTLRGQLSIFSRDFSDTTDPATLRVDLPSLALRRTFENDGRYVPEGDWISAYVTPTGLPIERAQVNATPRRFQWSHAPLRRGAAKRFDTEWTLEFEVPSESGAGVYVPQLNPIVVGMPAKRRHFDAFASFEGIPRPSFGRLTVGEPAARIPWILGFDEINNGTRGALAREDRGRFGYSNHVKTTPEAFIVAPGRYRLDPYVPIALGRGRLPGALDVPLKFPSGSLAVKVTKPDGTTEDLGSATFQQIGMRSPLSRLGQTISGLSAHVSDFCQLLTLNPRFEYSFSRTGKYLVTLTGEVEDQEGNVYRGGGTYEITVARSLDIETAVISGTPFEAGDAANFSLVVQPPVPAKVEIRVRLGDEERMILGEANRFGYFSAPEEFTFKTSGEYRVDVIAEYVDEGGTLWAAATSWGSVVETPDGKFIARGRRSSGDGDVMYPFQSGDVMSLRDTQPGGPAAFPIVTIEDRAASGEIPLNSTAAQTGYFYASAYRPGVHVRELITDDQTNRNAYWRFDDNYQFQLGNGANGDLINDFAFLFGGAVYRAPKDNVSFFGAYASLFVLIDNVDSVPAGVSSPFSQPLMQLKRKDIDIFFHPTAVRPGTILETGELASFAGYSAPTLPAHLAIVVTSPSGVVRRISGTANKIGYFFEPSANFRVDEPGVWRARVKIDLDGKTGDVLGSRDGEFNFYVVDPQAQPLNVGFGFTPAAQRIGAGPVPLNINPPPGMSVTQIAYTTTMPGFILEEGTAITMRYTYDPIALSRDFPNLDLNDNEGHGGADSITMAIFLTGADSEGRRRYLARQVVIQGEELHITEQKAAQRPRRRAAR